MRRPVACHLPQQIFEAHFSTGLPQLDMFYAPQQQGDILPINIIVPMKSRFTILFTRCARIGYR
jgi:hypothetical protein